MEPLSVAASIIAVIQISGKLVKWCTAYIESVKDAPQDLRIIHVEISTLKAVFEPLKVLSDNISSFERLHALQRPIENCRRAVTDLHKLVGFDQHDQDGRQDAAPSAKAGTLSSLFWPKKMSRARKLTDEIGRYKTTISLALTIDTL